MTQPWKSTMKALKQYLKSIQSQPYKHQNDVIGIDLLFLLVTLTVYHTFFSISIIL